jgi:transposase
MDGGCLFSENDFVWRQNVQLRLENDYLRREAARTKELSHRNDELELRNRELSEENAALKVRVADLEGKLKRKVESKVPPFVKPNVARKRRKRPGRPEGHPAALRPMPEKVDVDQEVPLPVDEMGKCCCPHCRTQLSEVEKHKRIVEDFIPAKLVTTCYRTTSGFCPSCRKRVESREESQPPAADLPHGQLGLNALATAAVMRVCYRLPFRQITRLMSQIPGIRISSGAIARQIQRLGRWLEAQYEGLQLVLRAAGVVYADETGWRTDGWNGWLWTLTNEMHTLFHVDKSRGGKVIRKLLGKGFGSGNGTLVSDFFTAYGPVGGSQQKCNVHLLRELENVVTRRPKLKGHAFFRRCKRVVKEMLKLKKKREEMQEPAYAHQVELLESRLKKLAEETWKDADAKRLAKRLRKYREQLTTFLHKPEVEGTNNAAERALRPAVVMRKITGGSRSEAGAKAWAILASVMRTVEQQGRDVVVTIKELLKAAWAGKGIALLTDSS